LLKCILTANGKLLRGKSVTELITSDMSTLTKCRAERWLSARLRRRRLGVTTTSVCSALLLTVKEDRFVTTDSSCRRSERWDCYCSELYPDCDRKQNGLNSRLPDLFASSVVGR